MFDGELDCWTLADMLVELDGVSEAVNEVVALAEAVAVADAVGDAA